MEPPSEQGPDSDENENEDQPDPEELMAEARRLTRQIIEATKKEAARTFEVAETRRAEAETQAREMIKEAETQVERIQQEARESGFVEGVEAGREQGYGDGKELIRDELQGHIELITELASKATLDERQLLKGAEQDTVTLAISIAERIIRRELSLNPVLVTSMVEEAVQQIVANGPAQIRVNPDDWEIVSEYWEVAHQNDVAGPLFEVVKDYSVEVGGCIVESATGRVDAQISTQMKAIWDGLLGE